MRLFGSLIFWLLCAHAVCDYPLQGDFLAKAKDHAKPIPGISWRMALFWHALIHAGGVALVTGLFLGFHRKEVFLFGFLELLAHMAIDFFKCRGEIDFETDQVLHVACKIAYAVVLMATRELSI